MSITRITRIVREFRAAGYAKETPVAVVYRVGWPDQLVLRGTLSDIAVQVREAKITLQALILVGPALDPALRQPDQPGAGSATSHLYSADYTHQYRRSQTRTKAGESNSGKSTPSKKREIGAKTG